MRNPGPAGNARFLAFFLVISSVLAGCGEDSSNGGTTAGTSGAYSGAGGSATTCTPYETISCPCIGGGMGSQQCDAYGSSYSECNCSQTGAGIGGGGTGGTAGTSGTGGMAGTSGTGGSAPAPFPRAARAARQA
jgi:hypothetical protein